MNQGKRPAGVVWRNFTTADATVGVASAISASI